MSHTQQATSGCCSSNLGSCSLREAELPSACVHVFCSDTPKPLCQGPGMRLPLAIAHLSQNAQRSRPKPKDRAISGKNQREGLVHEVTCRQRQNLSYRPRLDTNVCACEFRHGLQDMGAKQALHHVRWDPTKNSSPEAHLQLVLASWAHHPTTPALLHSLFEVWINISSQGKIRSLLVICCAGCILLPLHLGTLLHLQRQEDGT